MHPRWIGDGDPSQSARRTVHVRENQETDSHHPRSRNRYPMYADEGGTCLHREDLRWADAIHVRLHLWEAGVIQASPESARRPSAYRGLGTWSNVADGRHPTLQCTWSARFMTRFINSMTADLHERHPGQGCRDCSQSQFSSCAARHRDRYKDTSLYRNGGKEVSGWVQQSNSGRPHSYGHQNELSRWLARAGVWTYTVSMRSSPGNGGMVPISNAEMR